MKLRRKDGEEKKSGSWLMTYADLVTLMLTFFVLLFSFSSIDMIKWKNVVTSLQGSFGVLDGGPNVLNGISDDSKGLGSDDNVLKESDKIDDVTNIDDFLKYQEEMKKLEMLQALLADYLRTNGLVDSVSTTIEERGLILRFQDSVLFQKGRADLIPGSHKILQKVSDILKETTNPVRIEGHTDDLPIHTAQFPSNWELSAIRATNVLQVLVKEGLAGDRLSVAGYGEFHPIAENINEENRRKNRRVDIVIIRESLSWNEPR